MYVFGLIFFAFLEIYPGVVLLHHMVGLFLVFWETSKLFFPQWLHQFTPVHKGLPPVYKDSLFSTSLLTLVICVLFDDILTQMISDCSFDLHFSDVVMLSTFSFACWPFSCLLWRNDDTVLLLIFKLSCSFSWCSVVWAVYIVWILTS